MAEMSDTCCTALKTARCYACDGVAGIGLATGLCPSLCDEMYAACADDFFSWDARGTPVECGTGVDSVCSQLREAVGSGAQMCDKMGFQVAGADSSSSSCYDGRRREPPTGIAAAIAAQKRAAAAADEAEAAEAAGPDLGAALQAALASSLAPLRTTAIGRRIIAAIEDGKAVVAVALVFATAFAWRCRRRLGLVAETRSSRGGGSTSRPHSAEELRAKRLQRFDGAAGDGAGTAGGGSGAPPVDTSDDE
jgi:hypothetical protein